MGLEKIRADLWAAAELFRSRLIGKEYKGYFFAVLYYKRINDMFIERHAAVRTEIGEALADNPDFYPGYYVPQGTGWDAVAYREAAIGKGLNAALLKIEQGNTADMDGVFSSLNFEDTAMINDFALSELFFGLCEMDLSIRSLTMPQMGKISDHIAERFFLMDEEHSKTESMPAPPALARLLVEILKPSPGLTFYDPCAGNAEILTQAGRFAAAQSASYTGAGLYGQEREKKHAVLGRLCLYLNGFTEAQIKHGDTFLAPKYRNMEGGGKLFDLVAADIPWNQSEWHQEKWINGDTFKRFGFGIAPKNNADWAWVQLMLAALQPKGKMALAIDAGALYRAGTEASIRKALVEADKIEAVIQLPPCLFDDENPGACVLVINQKKPADRARKTLFVDASRKYGRQNKGNELREEDIFRIVNAYDEFQDILRYCTVSDISEIEENHYSLHLPCFVDATEIVARPLQAVFLEIKELDKKIAEANLALYAELKKNGLG